jgi:hypothetical protein
MGSRLVISGPAVEALLDRPDVPGAYDLEQAGVDKHPDVVRHRALRALHGRGQLAGGCPFEEEFQDGGTERVEPGPKLLWRRQDPEVVEVVVGDRYLAADGKLEYVLEERQDSQWLGLLFEVEGIPGVVPRAGRRRRHRG